MADALPQTLNLGDFLRMSPPIALEVPGEP
jgi:hypothetical protein